MLWKGPTCILRHGSQLWSGRWTPTCRGKAEKNKDSRAVLFCGSPMCDSYPQTPAHWAGKDHECCRGSPQYTTFQTLVLEPCVGVRSMGPVWGWRGGLTVLWIITWESRLWWPVLVSRSMGCKGCRGHTLWNASQIKGSYLLSSRRHHKPWRSCRAFEKCHCVQTPSRLQDQAWETKKENLPVMRHHCGDATFQTEMRGDPRADRKGSKA